MSKIISIEQLLESFYISHKDKYPHLSREQIDLVCRAQFKMMKQVMESGSLEPVRLKYLFNITVSPQRVMKQLRFMSHYVPGKTMNEERYNYYLNIVLSYIKRNNDKFRKYEDRITKYTGLTIREISARTYPDYGHSSHT